MPTPFRDPSNTIAAAAARVARQRQIVASLLLRGLPAGLAIELLGTMERVLATLQSMDLFRPAIAIRTYSQNQLLARLSADDIECVSGSAQLIDFDSGHVFVSPHAMHSIWFIESGVVAVVGGDAAHRLEVGTIGREGAVGSEAIFGASASPLGHIAVFGGQALQIDASLLPHFGAGMSLVETLLRFNEVLHVQSAAAAVAGARYTIDQRLARSLLMYQDRADRDELDVTHLTLSESLGVRRAGVTDAVHRLEGDHLIKANRSSIVVRDREGLRNRAGGSYGLAENAYQILFPAQDRQAPVTGKPVGLRPAAATLGRSQVTGDRG